MAPPARSSLAVEARAGGSESAAALDAGRSRAPSRLAFPLVLGGAIGGAIGLAPLVGAPLALGIMQLAAIVAIAVWEHVTPHRVEWNRSHGDILTDAIHAAVSATATIPLTRLVVGVIAVALAGPLTALLGTGLWPTSWPVVAQLALALVVVELPQYWLHRWQHEDDRLWRFHAVHHSAPRLYWLNAARFHPGDLGLLYAVGYLPLVLLGCPELVIALFFLFDAVFGMLQHSNIDVRLGPLNYVFSMAEPHRWHHSRVLEEANTNYGSNLIVWDLVFGTFFLPDREPPRAIGIAGLPAFPGGYAAQLAAPFRWQAVQREAAAAPTAIARDTSA